MKETTHLLSTEANAERLAQSIVEDQAGKITVRELEGTKFYGKKKSSLKRHVVKSAL